MEAFDFNDLRHSLPALQPGPPSRLNVNRAFYLPAAAPEASSATYSSRDSNATFSGIAQSVYQSPYPPIPAQDGPSTTTKDIPMSLLPTGARTGRKRNRGAMRKKRREMEEAIPLTGDEDKAFKALRAKLCLVQRDRKDQIDFFRKNYLGAKEYGWTTNSNGVLGWSNELFQNEWDARHGQGQNPGSRKTVREQALERQPAPTLSECPDAIMGLVALDTDVVEHTHAPGPSAPTFHEKLALGADFINSINHYTETEVTRIGREEFLRVIAHKIGKAEAEIAQDKFRIQENERKRYGGFTYSEHKNLELLRSRPTQNLEGQINQLERYGRKLARATSGRSARTLPKPPNFERSKVQVAWEVKKALEKHQSSLTVRERTLLSRYGLQDLHLNHAWSAMMGMHETETVPTRSIPPANPKEPSFKSPLLNFLYHCTDKEATDIDRETFINELALEISKDETELHRKKLDAQEKERREYAGLTYNEHKELDRLRATSVDKLPKFVQRRLELLENRHKQFRGEVEAEAGMEVQKTGKYPFDKVKCILQTKPAQWGKKDKALLRRTGFENIHKSNIWARMMGNQHKTTITTTAAQFPVTQPRATSEETKLIGKEFIQFIENDNRAAQLSDSLIDELALKIAQAEYKGKSYAFKSRPKHQKEIEELRAIPTANLSKPHTQRLEYLEHQLEKNRNGGFLPNEEYFINQSRHILQKDIKQLTNNEYEILVKYGLETLHTKEAWGRIIVKPIEQDGEEHMGAAMTGNPLHTGIGFRMGRNNEIEIVDMDVETETRMTGSTGSQAGLPYGIGGTDVDILDIEMG